MTNKEAVKILRSALVGLVGEDDPQELTGMRMVLVAAKKVDPQNKDLSLTINAVDALLSTQEFAGEK